jgi:hypothetical protein
MKWYRDQEGRYLLATPEVAKQHHYILVTSYEIARAFCL